MPQPEDRGDLMRSASGTPRPLKLAIRRACSSWGTCTESEEISKVRSERGRRRRGRDRDDLVTGCGEPRHPPGETETTRRGFRVSPLRGIRYDPVRWRREGTMSRPSWRASGVTGVSRLAMVSLSQTPVARDGAGALCSHIEAPLVHGSQVRPIGRRMTNVDEMVFTFADAHLRNLAGRAVRDAGYTCFGSHIGPGEKACLLTVQEAEGGRRDAAEHLIRQESPSARRLT